MLLLQLLSSVVVSGGPDGLLADFQKSPATGVRAEPRFGWIVPPCATGADHVQAAYQVRKDLLSAHLRGIRSTLHQPRASLKPAGTLPFSRSYCIHRSVCSLDSKAQWVFFLG